MKPVSNPRTRKTGALTPFASQWNWYNSSQPIPTPSTGLYARRQGYEKVMTDYVSPNFRKLQAEGGIVNNPMSISETTFNCGDAGWRFENRVTSPPTVFVGEWSANYCTASYGPPARPRSDQSLIDHLTSLASTSAWADVGSSAINLTAQLAQYHQVLNMLGDPVRALSAFFWQHAWANADWKAARGRAGKAKALARLLSSLWLQYQYAFKPAIMDVEAILNELQNQTFNPRHTARAQQKREVNRNDSWKGTNNGLEIDFTSETKSEYVVRASILYDAYVSIPQRFGLHWTALPDALWEITPWSFVVDWFINVGDYICALTPKAGVRVLATSTTVEEIHTVKRIGNAIKFPSPGWTTVRNPGAVETAVYRNKTRRPSVDAPSLTTEWDPFYSLRGNRGINAYMLFLQQFIKA